MDITEFIAARLTEDEAAANEVHRPGDCGCVDRDGDFSPDPVWCGCGYPDRVLREVKAKRAIMARHKPIIGFSGMYCAWCSDDTDTASLNFDWPCPDIRALAAVYEWTP